MVFPTLAGVCGRYFELEREVALRPIALDTALAAALYEQAARFCGLTPATAPPAGAA